MCATYEGRVIGIDGDTATVDADGRRQRAIALLVPDLRPGERVLLGLGMVLRRIEPDEQPMTADVATAGAPRAAAGRGAIRSRPEPVATRGDHP
jgi:hydrogenase maturation factor